MRRYHCSCGMSHQPPPDLADFVERGRNVRVTAFGDAWWVPRIYVAVHGLRVIDVPVLAYKYSWKRDRRRMAA